MIMTRQKCQVIVFVGMDAQVLKIPDYDTPEKWILLRYIRDKLWQFPYNQDTQQTPTDVSSNL